MSLEQLGWDGTSETRQDTRIYAAPDGSDWDSLLLWVDAVQQALQGNEQLNLVAGQNLLAGQPFYMAYGAIWPAQANDETLADACGVTIADAEVNDGVACVTRGQVTRTDWSPVAGYIDLIPGATYYLHPTVAGTITTVAPILPGHFVVSLGKAVSPTTLDVNIEKPIGL
jgi:hypothetical protein